MKWQDLLGPSSENEILNQNPRFEYIVGMLAPQTSENDSNEQEIDGDASFEGDADYTAGEDDDNEPVFTNRFKTPSSIGISFYLESSTKSFNVDVTWGDYTKASDKTTNKEGKEVDVSTYKRHPQKETVVIDLQEFSKNKEYPLVCDSNVILYVSKIGLKQGYTLITAYVNNKRKNPESDIAGMMFQVNLRAYSQDKMDIFVAEHICRKILAVDEFYFAQRPILGRGRGCAATWKANKNGRASEIVSTFIPEYEFPGVSAALEGFDPFFFSMRTLSVAKKKDDIINRLNVLANSYEDWIQKKLIHDSKMDDAKFKKEIGDTVINKCIEALGRIRAGIQLLVEDDTAFDAFCFMNRSMILQRNIMNFSKKHGAGIECAFRDFVDPRDPSNNFGWRPFQIAFILMNLKGIVDPEHDNREVVDLLYFPTGGGKTEAYLGLMAFVIANRRLRAEENDEYNRDGGVTAILRYTLRLLTTQQRDRITKMILAAELIRQKEYPKYGKEPISIGFWVGGTVTPNTFKELEEAPEDPAKTRIARSKKNSIYKQLLTCPFCGKPLTEENFYIDIPTKSVSIYCSDDKCMFYRYKPSNKIKIPVYLVDEEIYAKCPTIILSTVDKFARLPWDVNTNALFGRVDRICSRDGYVAIGADHARHNRTEELPTSTLRSIKPFLPPELIIQDELHLITGPLGTVYGAYETVIEDLCSYTIGEKKIKPKYVVSTATIKNAAEQTKCLYGRKVTAQFPPNGFEIGDSFYIREVPVEQDPFRRYVGVCAPGQSVKTALLRVYSIILQSAYNLSLDDEYKDVIDPYYTLVGYYNSIRELGGAVRLLQDDIPDRIQRIKKKYGMSRQRFLNHKVEITSRMSSYDIPKKLSQLETPYTDRNCLDTAIATNMIAVGMDVDRLGLMVVTGQPKQNSEYIQATSRIGRSYPGLVVGFTRVDAPDPDADEQTNIVYLNKGKTEKWLPAAEVHGEGVFIEFNRDSIDAWLRDPELGALSQKYAQCYKEFCESKEWTVTTLRDARYVLMHTFAHLLIKQMSMSSGYSSSAIRERIYFGDDMSGVLLYTGSADKEGSLGGLVELGNIDQLIVLMKDAFQEALVCTNDPECLNNVPAGNNSNGAACHSCCMISETACENGNRMLDRGLIVPIDGRENQSYFKTLVEELCQLEV